MKKIYLILFLWFSTINSLTAQTRVTGLLEHNTNFVYFGQNWLEEIKVLDPTLIPQGIPHNSVYTFYSKYATVNDAVNDINNLIYNLNNNPSYTRYYDSNSRVIMNRRHSENVGNFASVVFKINNIYYYDVVSLSIPQLPNANLTLDRKTISTSTSKLNAAVIGGPCQNDPNWSFATQGSGNHFFNSSFTSQTQLAVTFPDTSCTTPAAEMVNFQSTLPALSLTPEFQGCEDGLMQTKITITGGMGVYEVATGKQINIERKTTSEVNTYDYYQLLGDKAPYSNNVFKLTPGSYTFKVRDASYYDSKFLSKNMDSNDFTFGDLATLKTVSYASINITVPSCSVTSCPSNGINLGTWSVTNQSIYARNINSQLWVAQTLPADYGEDAIKIRGKNMISRGDVTSNYKNTVSCFAGSDSGVDGLAEPVEFNNNGLLAGYEKVSFTGTWGLIENYWRKACPSDGTNLGTWSVTGQSLVARKINNLMWVGQALPADYGTDAIVIRGKNMISRGDVTSNFKNKLGCFAGLDSDYGGLAEPTDFNNNGILAGYEKVSFTGSWGLIQNYWRKKTGSCYTITMRYNNKPVGVGTIPNNPSSYGLTPLTSNTLKFEPVPNENTFYIKAIGGNNGYLTVGSAVDPWNTLFIFQAQFTGVESQKWHVATLTGATQGYDTRIYPKSNPSLTWNFYNAPGTPFYQNIYGLASWWGGQSGEGGDTESFKRVAVGCPNSRVAFETETSDVPVIDLSISPNPTPDKFRASIVTKELGKYNFFLMTNGGEVIKTWKVDTDKGDKEIEVDISNYRYGSYLLKVVSESGKTTVKRVFKHEE